MYFSVNFNVFFKLIKVHLLVSELYVYQNARCNDKKKMLDCVLENEKPFGLDELKLSSPDNIYSLMPVPKFMEIVAINLGYNVRTDRRPSHGKNWSTWGKYRPHSNFPESSFP